MTKLVWPLHPRPLQDESLASWLGRVAHVYGLAPQTLLKAQFDWDTESDAEVDFDFGEDAIAELAERAGVTTEQLIKMTVLGQSVARGIQPHRTRLSDEERDWDDRVLDRVRDNEDPPPGWRLWWSSAGSPISRACRQCISERKTFYSRMGWRNPITVVCPSHNGFLERASIALGEGIQWHEREFEAAPASLVRIDRISRYALSHNLAGPDRESLSSADWFRLLLGLIGSYRLQPAILGRASASQRRFAEMAGLTESDLGILAHHVSRYEGVRLDDLDPASFELRLPPWLVSSSSAKSDTHF